MFVVIDGIDGAGKGTQVKLVAEYLEMQGKKVKIIDFPRYGEKSAFFVEKYLNGEYGNFVKPKLASLFYALDRFDASKELKEDLNQYDYIISNRYVSASMIHQSGKIVKKEEVDTYLEWLDDLEYTIFSIPRPDITLFLDVSPEISSQLIGKKEQREYIKGGENKDIHEKDENHLRDAYNMAHYVAKKFDWKIIDCVEGGNILTKEKITQKILSCIL
ncbi:deoxynucleoside kinase [Candidatus Gracilibacteria bacterium]|nr:deoxynucleoside kinase [Candidatus Gracilibacteria bacterium]NUJ98879.1 deoxynucleoside kinase [Candidatus Gracilibacteria bacterium]